MRLQKMIVHVAHIRCGIILLVKKKKKIASFNFVRNIFHFYKGIIADLRSCFGNFRINKLKKICKTKGRV